MRLIIKKCAHCRQEFRATCGVAKFCSDRCHLLANVRRESGCWLWTTGFDKDGYGVVRLRGRRRLKAHRAAYQELVGPIPDGQWICHSCDTPACINPEHLFLGDALANKTDCVLKARHVHGAGVYWTNKLTEPQVIAIRADQRSGPEIARDYGVSKENVYAIRDRKSWKHLPG